MEEEKERKYYEEFSARYLNPLTDFGFHKILGEESNKDVLIHFLNQVIKEKGSIKSIKYLPTEQWGNYETDRKLVFDVHCTAKNGGYFIVEMQKARQTYFRDRSIFYISMAVQKQALKGKWDFRLEGVYFVAILDFVFFKEKDSQEQVVEYVHLIRESSEKIYSNKLKFAFVELPKFNKTEEELVTNFDIWLYIY